MCEYPSAFKKNLNEVDNVLSIIKNIKKTRNYFTLVELLIVIAVIGILITLLLPSLRNARLSAMGGVSMSNLSQIYRGAMNYAKDHNQFLPLCGGDGNPTPYTVGTELANWRPPVYEYISGVKFPADREETKGVMETGGYRDIMYCPIILQDRNWAYPDPSAQGRGHYGQNIFFGMKNDTSAHPSNDTTKKGYKSVTFASLTADKEPLYMATKKRNSGSSGEVLEYGEFASNDKNSPEYIYSNKKGIACFLEGNISFKSISWGSSVDILIQNQYNFE
jgi:prepilin-type N-terminal cleavage/methylation domain-containing protein